MWASHLPWTRIRSRLWRFSNHHVAPPRLSKHGLKWNSDNPRALRVSENKALHLPGGVATGKLVDATFFQCRVSRTPCSTPKATDSAAPCRLPPFVCPSEMRTCFSLAEHRMCDDLRPRSSRIVTQCRTPEWVRPQTSRTHWKKPIQPWRELLVQGSAGLCWDFHLWARSAGASRLRWRRLGCKSWRPATVSLVCPLYRLPCSRDAQGNHRQGGLTYYPFLLVGPGSGFPPEGMQRRRPWPYRTVYEWLVGLSSCANYTMIVDAVPYPVPPYFQGFYTLACRNLLRTRWPHRLGRSAGFLINAWHGSPEPSCAGAPTGQGMQAHWTIRQMESLVLKCLTCSNRRRLVRIARSSRPLMCSFWLAHFQPDTTFHFQHCAGTVALNLWNLTICVPGVVGKMSSPLTQIKFPSLAASLADWSTPDCFAPSMVN